MNLNIDLGKLFKGKKNTIDLKKEILPTKDWKYVVITFAIINLCISVFVWILFTSDKIGGGILNNSLDLADPVIISVDKKRLSNDVNFMNQKIESFSDLKENKTVVKDPSR